MPAGLNAQDSASVRLVAQQNGQGLVMEERVLSLPKGAGQVILPELPATIDAHTLQVRSKTSPKGLKIHDLALDEELLTPSSLLKRHLGKKVTLVLPDGKSRDGRIQKEAVVLSTDEAPLFLVDGKVYAGPYDAVIYPELPDNLSAKPRLSLNVENAGPARQTLELAYLAREIGWRMDYVLTMNKAGTSGLLSGWATLTNRSGRDFRDASVELLAGEPRSVRPVMARALAGDGMLMAKASFVNESVESEELAEYHLYKLKNRVSLLNQQSRQVPLFEPAAIPVTRRLVGRSGALPSGREAEPRKENLDVVLSFRNIEASGLGAPLPKGTLRAFQDDAGTRHFLGEAGLERVPVGASAELRIGQAFDVSVERIVTDYEKTGKSSYRATWELRIRNSRKQSQQIVLQELLPGKWKMENASHKWNKASAGMLEFVVDVPPGRDAEPLVLKYTFNTEL
jgi:hypothetical protein